MKKLVALLLAVVMCVGLFAGCGGNNDAKGNSGSKDNSSSKDNSAATDNGGSSNQEALADPLHDWILEEDTSIEGQVRFYIPFSGPQGMDDMIAEFNETYPNIEIVLNTYSNNTDGNVALNTAIMAGECDVVASFSPAHMNTRVENGLYIDLTERFEEDQIDIAANWGEGGTYFNPEGKYYVFPNGGLSHYVAINMTAWEEAGLGELPTEWTWEEYVEASRAMTKKNADGSTATYGGSQYQVIADMLNVVYQVNGKDRMYLEDGTSSFNQDFLKDAIQTMIDAEAEGLWYPMDTMKADNEKTWFTFTDGRVASTVICNLPRFIRDTEQFPTKFITGFAPYPTVEEGQDNYACGVNYFSFTGITTGCQDEDAAWAWAKWYSTYGSKYLTIAGHQSNWLGTDSDELVSLIFGSEEEAAKIIDVDSFKQWVGNSSNPNAPDTITTAWNECQTIWEEYVMYAFTGEMTVDEALDTAAELANKAIADASK